MITTRARSIACAVKMLPFPGAQVEAMQVIQAGDFFGSIVRHALILRLSTTKYMYVLVQDVAESDRKLEFEAHHLFEKNSF